MEYTRKFDFSKVKGQTRWALVVADEIIAIHPDEKLYTVAAGISPSGVVHFGNFRDVVTAHMVREAFKEKGKLTRLIFSWDNFDRFRKVPTGISESFVEHIGKPLSKIPDPLGEFSSYAERFQKPFVEAMEKLGIEIEYRDQTALYESGAYDEQIFHCLKNREKIADIMLSFMTDKAKGEKGIDPLTYRKNYYPISIYSRFTGKDITKIINYDGATTVTYFCVDTGKEDTVDLSKDHIAKLAWKIDWPMRWKYEGVVFEPGGHDHASPGGSYDVSSVVSKTVFDYEPPIFVEYKFVGIQGLGSKMSGSKGNAVSPLELLDVYEPELLKWLYFRKSPNQPFELAFNTEIYRQYDEYDTEHPEEKAIPFRQAVGFGQVVQWNKNKLQIVLKALGHEYSQESIARRLHLAKNWLTKYNPDEVIKLNDAVNREFAATMSDVRKEQVKKLRDELEKNKEMSIQELDELVYRIPKTPELDEAELKKEQRAFFKDIYNLLIGKDTGPRLGTFLWAVDREQVLKLLEV
ncbi:lysine--tRNA ligase [Candidatus Nomurabacteria bacterium RIFCSPLOWO2_01_FULL_40_15]|uniref:Lysine--tRNA ligase n=1 Tax=Candidatus Nomurabacteria bacterium RIFCSPLOWO2_01_FULL_40_15 TaxID=1801772 RepID=A0A1F6X8H9_9BACT|nr:MAG: lysine--tRNA ligase [Candidatus Nomurabacteria bacterium RIFCSPLOWO2_01_FULL_40_15]